MFVCIIYIYHMYAVYIYPMYAVYIKHMYASMRIMLHALYI